jgi:flagellar assembly protein FliH
MKLSNNTGLIKKSDMNVTEAIFDEFDRDGSVIRIGKKHFDLDDEHYAIQKVVGPVHQHQEINKTNGQKIFIGQDGVRDSEISDGEIGNRPTIIAGGGDKSFVSTWELDEFDRHVEPIETAKTKEDDSQVAEIEDGHDIESEYDAQSIIEAKGLSKEIIENANKEAQRILEAAQKEAEEVKNKAQKEGYQAGFAEVNTEIDILRKIQVEMNKSKEEILKNTEPEIIELLKMIAEKLFTNGMVLDANILKDIVGRAINEASRIGNLKVYLNPGDLDKLKKLWRESELEFNGQKIQLASNNEVMPGGVYVEGDYGSVDGRIATQMDSVLEKINDIRMEEQEVV